MLVNLLTNLLKTRPMKLNVNRDKFKRMMAKVIVVNEDDVLEVPAFEDSKVFDINVILGGVAGGSIQSVGEEAFGVEHVEDRVCIGLFTSCEQDHLAVQLLELF